MRRPNAARAARGLGALPDATLDRARPLGVPSTLAVAAGLQRVVSEAERTMPACGPMPLSDIDDPNVIRAFQQYTDTASASAFLTTPAYGEYGVAVEHLLVGPPAVRRTDIIWTKGQ